MVTTLDMVEKNNSENIYSGETDHSESSAKD